MSEQDFSPPRDARYFEDYVPGLTARYGAIAVNRAEMMEFARRYDPQSMHTDETAAAAGPFGDIIASGWHTIALVMPVFVERYLSAVAGLVSPGVDEIRWLAPVRPGDVLSVRISVLEAIRSRSKPDRGMVRSLLEVLNQNEVVVMSAEFMNLLRCREPEAAVAKGPLGFA